MIVYHLTEILIAFRLKVVAINILLRACPGIVELPISISMLVDRPRQCFPSF